MDRLQYFKNKISNGVLSFIIFSIMGVLFLYLSYLLLGILGVFLGPFFVIFSFLALKTQGATFALRLNNAYYVTPLDAQRTYKKIVYLSRKAHLERIPDLYMIPTNKNIAFSTQNKDRLILALSHGILSNMSERELSGIIAHEISHLANNDFVISIISQLIGRLISSFAFLTSSIFLLFFPLILFGLLEINIWSFILILLTPSIISLLQLKLSRTREYQADLDGAKLTQDPIGLALALKKLETKNGLFRMWTTPEIPEILSTHPKTEKRVSILRELIPSCRY